MKYIFHEVRVPLNSITMGIECLNSRDDVDEEETETLLMMKEATSFMSNTLNDVLNMQRIEEGKLELTMKPFSISNCLETVKLTFRGPSSSKQISIEVIINGNVPRLLMGDSFRLEHVVANFLSNALKFSPAGTTITITVSSVRKLTITKELAIVTVAVKDQGPGISAEDQRQLFTAFMQIRPKELQAGGGSGIGLSVCKQVVELHGGTVRCESEVGQGSVFSFTIPFAIAAEDSIECLIVQSGPSANGPYDTSSPQINSRIAPSVSSNKIADMVALEDGYRNSAVMRARTSSFFEHVAVQNTTFRVSLASESLGSCGSSIVQNSDDGCRSRSNNRHLTARALLVDGKAFTVLCCVVYSDY